MLSSVTSKLLLLFAGHALCDYPLQGDFLARGKNHKAPIPGIPWYQCLLAHALIHAGMVYLVTGHLWMASAELGIHAATDYAKCDGRITFNQDQGVHYACKVLWAIFCKETTMPSEAAKALFASIPDDEPVFIVRGTDKLATPVVEKWIAEAQIVSVPQARIQETIDTLVEISRFQGFNPGRVKYPA